METSFTPEAVEKEITFFDHVLMIGLLVLALIGAGQVFLVWIPAGIHSYAQSEVNTYIRTHTGTKCTTMIDLSLHTSHAMNCETVLQPD